MYFKEIYIIKQKIKVKKEVQMPKNEFTLSEFQIDPRFPYPTIFLVGKRGAGKSTLTVGLASLYTHIERWAAWCGTKDTMDYWSNYFGHSGTVYTADERGIQQLKSIIRYQQDKVRLYNKVLKEPFPDKYTVGLIFDDVTGERLFRKCQALEDLFANGRHYKCVIIVMCQYPKQFPPAIRSNADYIVMLQNTKRVRKILYEEYIEEPGSLSLFCQLLQAVTSAKDPDTGQDLYYALIYQNIGRKSRLDDIFCIYRVDNNINVSQIRLGSETWRKWCSDHYIDREVEEYKKRIIEARRTERLNQYVNSIKGTAAEQPVKEQHLTLTGKKGQNIDIVIPLARKLHQEFALSEESCI